MTLDQLTRLLSKGESERLELKKSTGDLKGGLETLCAFLNGEGGRVVFGVTKGARIIGQDIADATLQEVAQELRRQSLPRNPLLANVFYLRGLIERWGRGTQKIVELCVRAGHPEPEFEERASEFVVRFIPSGYVPPHRVSHDLTQRQRRILHVLGDGATMRSGEIRSQLEPAPSVTALRNDLNFLRSLELIEGSGHGAGARWCLKTDRPAKTKNRAQ